MEAGFLEEVRALLASGAKDRFPRMAYRFRGPASWFMNHPRLIVAVCPVVIIVSIFSAFSLTYERDVFKAFVARGMDSLEDAKRISARFKEDFALPTNLTFEVASRDRGIELQKLLDNNPDWADLSNLG